MNWISVKDRLSENEQAVLVYVKGFYTTQKNETIMLTSIYTDGKHSVGDSDYYKKWSWTDYEYDEETDEFIIIEGWWGVTEDLDNMIWISGTVTHWMPLPEPPKE